MAKSINTSRGDLVFLDDMGKYHNEHGPAVITESGNKYWFKSGLLHREDGPAIEYISGENKHYLNGLKLT